MTGPAGEVAAAIAAIGLVDHHVHPAVAVDLSPAAFGEMITESDRPAAAGTSRFDRRLGPTA